MYKSIKYLLSTITIISFFSCNFGYKKNKAIELKIINQQIDTAFGLSIYNVYASDTAWDKMKVLGDSLSRLYNPKIFNIVFFYYPEHSIPAFKEGAFFSEKKISHEPYFVIGKYYDTSFVHQSVLKKRPDNFIEAKAYEKSKGR